MGERIRRVKVWKLVRWDKESLTAKAKVAQARKAQQLIHSLLPISRWVFSHFQESGASSCVAVTWEDKCHHSEYPPFLLFTPTFIAERYIICYGISLWPVGVICPGSVPSQLLVQSQCTHCWGSVRSGKGLDSV